MDNSSQVDQLHHQSSPGRGTSRTTSSHSISKRRLWLDGESAHDDTWSKTKGKWLGICGRAEKGGRNSFNARPAYGFEEMRPGPDDRCMPDFRKSHSRAPGAWPASPSIRSRVRARTHRSTLASGAVPRVIVPRAPPTDPSLCQPGHSRAHGMSAAPPRARL
jgi:hypothetical protein